MNLRTKYYMIALLAMSFLIVNCGDGDSSNNNYSFNGSTCVNEDNQSVDIANCGTLAANGNYWVNGLCYNSAGQQLNSNNCGGTNTINNGYYISNGNCYNSSGHIVNDNLCSLDDHHGGHVNHHYHHNYNYNHNNYTYHSRIHCDGYYFRTHQRRTYVRCFNGSCRGRTVYNVRGLGYNCL